MGWKSRDTRWRHETEQYTNWLNGKESMIEECLKDAFETAKEKHEWARSCHSNLTLFHPSWHYLRCEPYSTSKACMVRDAVVRGHYYRGEDEDELVVLSDALTEQEAFGIEALENCVRDISGNDKRFYEAREFGEDESAATFGMYREDGGNYCTFLNGLLQIYLPGVAASTSRVLQKAFNDSRWAETRDKPSPDTLGIHSVEFLKYRTTGKLGLHSDDESVYTVSIALSKFGDYE
eukprot:scaffold3028_cov174-Amphora_coffeaeformis.AAC.1